MTTSPAATCGEQSLYCALELSKNSWLLAIQVIAAILALIETTSGKTWNTDRQTFEEVKAVIDKTLEALGPTAPTAPNDQKLLDGVACESDPISLDTELA